MVISLLLLPAGLQAQAAGAILSGRVIGVSGQNVAHAVVSVKNLASGETKTVLTRADGTYRFPALPPGLYQVIANAAGLHAPAVKITLVTGTRPTLNMALSGVAPAPPAQNQAAPAAGLSLKNLGFTPNQIHGSPQEQARLNKRSRMLQIHQKLGLLTTIPLVATVIAGGFAKSHFHRLSNGQFAPLPPGSTAGRNIHAVLGTVTLGMYAATAYYAIFAPKIHGVKTRGPIRAHEILAWIHGPGMILTPILGEMAYAQLNRGERVHGIAKLHGVVAITTLAAYVAALLVVARPHWLATLSHAPGGVLASLNPFRRRAHPAARGAHRSCRPLSFIK